MQADTLTFRISAGEAFRSKASEGIRDGSLCCCQHVTVAELRAGIVRIVCLSRTSAPTLLDGVFREHHVKPRRIGPRPIAVNSANMLQSQDMMYSLKCTATCSVAMLAF